jgi:hypothetical protein
MSKLELQKKLRLNRRAHYFAAVKRLREKDPEGAEAWLKDNNMYNLARRDISAANAKINHRLRQLWILAGAQSSQVGHRVTAKVYAGHTDAPEGVHYD